MNASAPRDLALLIKCSDPNTVLSEGPSINHLLAIGKLGDLCS